MLIADVMFASIEGRSSGLARANMRSDRVNSFVFADCWMQTYSALVILRTLNADLSRLDTFAIRASLGIMQQPDGVMAACEGGECDMRFVFCAAAISALLPDSPQVIRQHNTPC